MPIFPNLELESTLQANDKTRLNATRSYASGGSAITKVEIKPTAAEAFYDVTEEMYLDWQYATAATHAVTVKLNGGSPSEITLTKDLTVVSEATDNLFANDDDLRKHEPDIMKYLVEGRASFKDVHRRAQTLILAWLDKEGYIDDFGDKLTVARDRRQRGARVGHPHGPSLDLRRRSKRHR